MHLLTVGPFGISLELCGPLINAKLCSIIKNSGRAVGEFFMCLLLVDCKQYFLFFFLILEVDVPDDLQVLIQKHMGQI